MSKCSNVIFCISQAFQWRIIAKLYLVWTDGSTSDALKKKSPWLNVHPQFLVVSHFPKICKSFKSDMYFRQEIELETENALKHHFYTKCESESLYAVLETIEQPSSNAKSETQVKTNWTWLVYMNKNAEHPKEEIHRHCHELHRTIHSLNCHKRRAPISLNKLLEDIKRSSVQVDFTALSAQ